MALVINDRVKETTTTTSTGPVALAGAVTGFETFAAGVGNSNTTYYCIAHQDQDEFEVGLGTLNGDSSTLTRTTVISSSNSDSAVNFSSGTKDVFCTIPASKLIFEDASNDVTIGRNLTVTGDLTITGDDFTMNTNTDTAIMVADGTNFNPVVPSGDVGLTNAGVFSIASGVIVNDDINASAAIADSKLATISTAGKVDIGALEIDGATDIGAALADADLFVVDDGAGGTNRKMAASRLQTYIEGKISGDITISSGTAAIGSGVIVNDDVNASAAIVYSKLSLADSIVNADINSSAAIADSKLATISTANKVSVDAVDIDGATDIGADLTTSDLIVVDDGAGGTNRKAALSRLTTYMTGQGFSTEDPTALAIALG
jgi:hypothetical protein